MMSKNYLMKNYLTIIVLICLCFLGNSLDILNSISGLQQARPIREGHGRGDLTGKGRVSDM